MMGNGWRRAWACLAGMIAAVAGAVPAQAAWLEARTTHFILYADMGEAALRQKAEGLERLDQVLRRFMRLPEMPEASSNKLTVFWTSDADIRQLCQCENVAGFYQPRVSGSVAFSGRMRASDRADMGQVVLFHEYAHHFLLGSYDIAFPSWYSEGFAEFASTTKIERDHAILGAAAQHRASALFRGEEFSATRLFDPQLWKNLRGDGFDAFYGRGWLLTHYISFEPARFVQFRDYLKRLNDGAPSLTAAAAAFGDMKALDRDVAGYLRQSRIPAMTSKFGDAPAPTVTIRPLGAGEAALIRLRMTSVRGVDRKTAGPLFRKAAPIAAAYPDDAVAQGWLAEMAYDAGDDAAAIAAANRAVARDAKSVQGLLYRARADFRRLRAAKSTDKAAWIAARKPVLAANRLDPDDAEPLFTFWQSFGMEGREPPKSALAGLYRAQELVPQDPEVRVAAALSRLTAGERDGARRLLRPLAYNPHAPVDNPAARMLAALDAGKPVAEVIAAMQAPAAAPGNATTAGKPTGATD